MCVCVFKFSCFRHTHTQMLEYNMAFIYIKKKELLCKKNSYQTQKWTIIKFIKSIDNDHVDNNDHGHDDDVKAVIIGCRKQLYRHHAIFGDDDYIYILDDNSLIMSSKSQYSNHHQSIISSVNKCYDTHHITHKVQSTALFFLWGGWV